MDKDIISAFENHLKDTKGLKKQSIKNYRADLRNFLSWLTLKLRSEGKNEALYLENLTLEHLQEYKNHLLTQKLAKSTVNRRLATTRTFCQFCYNSGMLEQNLGLKVNNLPHSRSQSKKVHDLVSKFGAYLKKKRSSKNTIKNYTADIRQFLEWSLEKG